MQEIDLSSSVKSECMKRYLEDGTLIETYLLGSTGIYHRQYQAAQIITRGLVKQEHYWYKGNMLGSVESHYSHKFPHGKIREVCRADYDINNWHHLDGAVVYPLDQQQGAITNLTSTDFKEMDLMLGYLKYLVSKQQKKGRKVSIGGRERSLQLKSTPTDHKSGFGDRGNLAALGRQPQPLL